MYRLNSKVNQKKDFKLKCNYWWFNGWDSELYYKNWEKLERKVLVHSF